MACIILLRLSVGPCSRRSDATVEGRALGKQLWTPMRYLSTRLRVRSCFNHRPGTLCAKYRHCPANLCIIQASPGLDCFRHNVQQAEASCCQDKQCPLTDSCQAVGVCAPSTPSCSVRKTRLPTEAPSCLEDAFFGVTIGACMRRMFT